MNEILPFIICAIVIISNQPCFNGMLSIGMSESGIFLRMGAVIFIPFTDMELTDKRKYVRYRILKIKDSDLQIGLEKKWINKFPTTINPEMSQAQKGLNPENGLPRF